MSDEPLALRLASTVRAERSGLTDRLATAQGLTHWVHEQDLAPYLDTAAFTTDEATRAQIVDLRQAVRALFARAVAPGPPSSADAAELPPFPDALALINAAAAPVLSRLDWRDAPRKRLSPTVDDPADRLAAALANAAVDFFADPIVAQIRVCPAPRCVLYFIKRHPRQEWCSVACGNRARAARHYHQHR
ncbi:CGNR zinc finger domain-containing protein [Actinomadura rubrisoli]|uniref:Zf-CGNR multi-domain protein n=1 Tax=Actinomadura rubrisoli TaxID=2530368 RepID=A0A4R5AWS3_9ACTN|nr:ABATE domain-containing protein [Actinomadura rubrisoli]TDD75102.1 zf-CGNR multi-domain protein [Actinomadura rubrisoli]